MPPAISFFSEVNALLLEGWRALRRSKRAESDKSGANRVNDRPTTDSYDAGGDELLGDIRLRIGQIRRGFSPIRRPPGGTIHPRTNEFAD